MTTATFTFAAKIIAASIYEPDPVRSSGRKSVYSITVEKHEGLRVWAQENRLPLFIDLSTGNYVIMNNERPEVTFVGATPPVRAAAFEALRVKGGPIPSADTIFLNHPVEITVQPKDRASRHRERVIYPTVVKLEIDLLQFAIRHRNNKMLERELPSEIPTWPMIYEHQLTDVVTEMKGRIHDAYHDTWDLIEALDELGECPHPKVRAAIEAARVSVDNIAHLVPED